METRHRSGAVGGRIRASTTPGRPDRARKTIRYGNARHQKATEAKAAIDKKDKSLAADRLCEALLNVTAIETENPRKPPANVTLYTERIEFTVAQQLKPGDNIGSANRSAAEVPAQEVRDAEGESTRV